jgi:hypothetical protein
LSPQPETLDQDLDVYEELELARDAVSFGDVLERERGVGMYFCPDVERAASHDGMGG